MVPKIRTISPSVDGLVLNHLPEWVRSRCLVRGYGLRALPFDPDCDVGIVPLEVRGQPRHQGEHRVGTRDRKPSFNILYAHVWLRLCNSWLHGTYAGGG